MNIELLTKSMEADLKAAGMGIATVLLKAGVDRSTWTRWKAGKTLPTMRSWSAVESAANALLPSRQGLDSRPTVDDAGAQCGGPEH